jgi:hypothetical protein
VERWLRPNLNYDPDLQEASRESYQAPLARATQ